MTAMTELEFRNYLSSKAVEIKLTHRLFVGKKGGPAPCIYDMDWNPKPEDIPGKDAIAALAAMSSFGTHIYYFPPDRKWKTLVIRYRPSRQGPCLRWHSGGQHLATSSDPSDTKQANLTLLSFDANHGRFDATHCVRANIGSKISSMVWISRGNILVVALFPFCTLEFFRLKRASGTFDNLGKRRCGGFPSHCPIALQSHPNDDYFFTCSESSDAILVWGKQTSNDRVKWGILRTVQSGNGLYAMTFSVANSGLITLQDGCWKLWAFTKSTQVLKLMFESCDEHRIIRGHRFGYASGVISVAASKNGRFLATGGKDDTLIVHSKVPTKVSKAMSNRMLWKPDGHRKGNVNYGQVKSVKFNPKEEIPVSYRFGGVYELTSGSMSVVDPERRHEHNFYSGSLDEAIVPSTSVDQEGHDDEAQGFDEESVSVVEQAYEVEVEYDGEEEEEVVEYEDDEDKEQAVEAEVRDEQQPQQQPQQEQHQQGLEAEVRAQQQPQQEQHQQGVDAEVSAKQQSQQVVEGGMESGATLSEKFASITKDAEVYKELISTGGTVSAAQVLSMCTKIIESKDAISNVLGKHNNV